MTPDMEANTRIAQADARHSSEMQAKSREVADLRRQLDAAHGELAGLKARFTASGASVADAQTASAAAADAHAAMTHHISNAWKGQGAT